MIPFIYLLYMPYMHPLSFSFKGDEGFLIPSYIKSDPSTLHLDGVSSEIWGSLHYYKLDESRYVYDRYNNRIGVRGINTSSIFFTNLDHVELGYGYSGFSVLASYRRVERNFHYREVEYVDEYGKVDSIKVYRSDSLKTIISGVVSYRHRNLGIGLELGYMDGVFFSSGLSYSGERLRFGVSYSYPVDVLFIHLSYMASFKIPTLGSVSVSYIDGRFYPFGGIAHYIYRMDAVVSYGLFLYDDTPGGIVELRKEMGERVTLKVNYRTLMRNWEEGDTLYSESMNSVGMGIRLRW